MPSDSAAAVSAFVEGAPPGEPALLLLRSPDPGTSPRSSKQYHRKDPNASIRKPPTSNPTPPTPPNTPV
ncbi:MAG: hypothetical protein LQ341_003958 [Variospora aurantia]|nr:MAG: hypothetical protein LQ341_003958 [Variospora aurantia]